MAQTPPTFAQVADAMTKIMDQLNAQPPPSPAVKQALTAAYQNLRGALDDIAMSDYESAASSVGDAAKQLQDVVDSQSANADPIQGILQSLGFSGTAAGSSSGQVPPPAVPPAPGSTAGGSSAAPTLSDRVPIPPLNQMNVGLSACNESTMLKKFGTPGNLTQDCSAATGAFIKRVRQSFDVGPFKVTGLDYAVESLLQVFSDVRKDNSQLFDQVKNAGMLCVRARRQNPGHFSNHSWGTAIDIFFGTDVVPQGMRLAHRGNLLLAPYFNRHGWYWGAGFSGDSVDTMHFELADETIARISDQPMFDAALPASVSIASSTPSPIGFQNDPAANKLLGTLLRQSTRRSP
jgi:hypothetical protein